jgi:hypothetical protein
MAGHSKIAVVSRAAGGIAAPIAAINLPAGRRFAGERLTAPGAKVAALKKTSRRFIQHGPV